MVLIHLVDRWRLSRPRVTHWLWYSTSPQTKAFTTTPTKTEILRIKCCSPCELLLRFRMNWVDLEPERSLRKTRVTPSIPSKLPEALRLSLILGVMAGRAASSPGGGTEPRAEIKRDPYTRLWIEFMELMSSYKCKVSLKTAQLIACFCQLSNGWEKSSLKGEWW